MKISQDCDRALSCITVCNQYTLMDHTLIHLQFNHHKKPDVALFDFTSIHQAEYAGRAIRRGGKDLYLCLIGDALLEVSVVHIHLRYCGILETSVLLAPLSSSQNTRTCTHIAFLADRYWLCPWISRSHGHCLADQRCRAGQESTGSSL